MNFLDELRWRGMLHQHTPGAEEHLKTGMRTGYTGFDPTAPSLTIGNFVQIMLLKLLQLSGHKPMVLMGGATGRIGDPSGKDKERELKSLEELESNLNRQVDQCKKFLEFDEGANKAVIRNNLSFYQGVGALEFLRDVGKHITINYMLDKDSVKNRLDKGISFTEFSYQVLQGYDYVQLCKTEGVTLQMGGSDQWGNITTGTHLIGKMLQNTEAHAITSVLLTKSDGSKFGKSEQGNIWLDPRMTSPYKFYQFWINADDADIPKYTRFFTLLSREEIETRERELADNPQELKRLLAEEITTRVHGRDDFEAVLRAVHLLFGRDANRETLLSLNEKSLVTVAEEIPRFEISHLSMTQGVNICDLIAEKTTIVPSRSEARRAIQGNAVSVNKLKIDNYDAMLNHEWLLHGKYLLIENGKKNKYMVEAI